MNEIKEKSGKGIAVAGFLFDHGFTHTVLIHKNRGPASIVGKWVGPGGKVDPGESPYDAMKREFLEEAGADVPYWSLFAEMDTTFYLIYYYWARMKMSDVEKCKTMEDEEIRIFPLDALPENTVQNALWMFEMLKDPFLQFPVKLNYVRR